MTRFFFTYLPLNYFFNPKSMHLSTYPDVQVLNETGIMP